MLKDLELNQATTNYHNNVRNSCIIENITIVAVCDVNLMSRGRITGKQRDQSFLRTGVYTSQGVSLPSPTSLAEIQARTTEEFRAHLITPPKISPKTLLAPRPEAENYVIAHI